MITYRGGYKKENFDDNIKSQIKTVITDFNPDIIHIFGTESELAYTTRITNVPCIIHIQGLLSPIYNIYFPPGINIKTFNSIFSLKEFWINNGIIFNYKNMCFAAKREQEHIKNGKYFMGRTEWDKSIVQLYNPKATYFHIDEILRTPFYNATKWQFKEGELILVSTISSTIYKGLDLVIKTATILKECGVNFQWNIIGVNTNNTITKKIEKAIGTKAKDVNIKFLGIKTADEIVTILQNATIYIHPSHIDNSPNSLCEAQYIGIPTIATNVGGIPTIMNYNNKYLVPSTDGHILAHKIITLNNELNNGTYCDIYTKTAEQRHNPIKIVKELKNLYSNIISQQIKNE